MPEPIAFLSYTRFDNAHHHEDDGFAISQGLKRLAFGGDIYDTPSRIEHVGAP